MLSLLLAMTPLHWSGLSDQVNALWPTSDDERWMQVGWRLDLFQARQEASDTGKPLFMWMMNGHPTGCT